MAIFDVEREVTEYQDKIDSIMSWAEERDDFDTSFVERMSGILRESGRLLTEAQKAAIDNIIERFGIET